MPPLQAEGCPGRILEIGNKVSGFRAAFEERFTARRMAEDYVRLYERMLDTETTALFGKAMLVAG